MPKIVWMKSRCARASPFGDPSDLTFADCMHRLVAFDRSACTLHRVESETRRDPRKVKIFEGAETMGDILTRRTAAG